MTHHRVVILCLSLCMFFSSLELAPAQRPGVSSNQVYKTRINPNWIGDGDHFWYRNDLHDGQREFVLVDAERGERNAAFDHQKLAAALTEAGVNAEAERLPLNNLSFDLRTGSVAFTAGDQHWSFDLESSKLKPGAATDVDSTEGLQPLSGFPYRTTRGDDTSITFVNRTDQSVEIFWIASPGNRTHYQTLRPGHSHEQHTFSGHVWEVVGEQNQTIAFFQATAAADQAIIKRDLQTVRPDSRRQTFRRGRFQRTRSNPVSPDGTWRAEVQDSNVVVVNVATNERVQLTKDGVEGDEYGRLAWSPDSQSLAAFRTHRVEAKKVYRINSAIGKNQFRGELQEQGYPLPGDEFSKHEPYIFHISSRKQIKPDVDPIDFGNPSFYWHGDQVVSYQKVDRGHQRFRLVEIDAQTGESRNIIDEKTGTFIWTMHMDMMRYPMVSWLDGNHEIIYVSEMDGFRHLFLIDVATGEIKNTITPGEYVVSEVDRVDQENRQVWFQATGMNKDQDPYFTHYYRINLDGTGLVELTEGDGTHRVEYSPNEKWFLDTYSRVDLPPVHELRRTSDGKLVCELETADVSHADWKPPTVFVAKGRDGETDIWGVISFPDPVEPGRKYPILEDIYAGPQGYFTPKSFSPRDRYRQWTELGFVVVKLDGMGTAGRSKAFHNVCWHNLKDAGFPDRIKWIKAAAEKFPCMDTDRVGIYGTSAGGQSAVGALLFHGDFYDAAVASCGCHDNRMDKSSWNEQWMGYPVGPHYAESSNIDNAGKMNGALMLIVGEVDSNVPPASTFKLADALIKADKDFEMVYLPGVGHSSGGAFGNRKRIEFFRKHLLDRDPENTEVRH